MSDRSRLSIAVFFYTVSATLPLAMLFTTAAALLGWIDLNASPWIFVALAVAAFLLPFLIATVFLAGVKSKNWFGTLLPYLAGIAYAVLPDPIPLPIDDAAAMGLGALASTWLAVRKNPAAPRWLLLPMLAAAAYTLIGGFIPGWLDELLVNLGAVLVALYGIRKSDP